MTPARMQKAEAWFQKYGVWTVTFGYFIPGVRHFTCYLSGISGIKFGKYIVFAGWGAAIWVITFVSLGHFVGTNWEKIHAFIRHYVGAGLSAAIIASLFSLYIALRIRRKKTA